MKQIDISDVDMLMVNDCKLNEIEACLEMLKFENIAGLIDFKKREEIAIYEYFTETTTQIAQLRVVLNQYISNLDFWYYKKAMEFLSKSDTINATDKLEKSLLINPFYIPALYQQVIIYLEKSQTEKAAKIAEFTAVNLYPVGNDWMLIRAMNEQINKQYKNRGEKMLAAEYCNESLEIFMQADTFCNYFKSADCEYFKKGIIQSKYGLFNSYLRVADQAMDAHKYSIAESFVMKAKEYASINRIIIINDDDADKFLKKIALKYIDLSLNFKYNADNSKSEYYRGKAIYICNLIKDKDCEAFLLNKGKELAVVEQNNIVEIPNNQQINKDKTKHHRKKNVYKKLRKIKKLSKPKKNDLKTISTDIALKHKNKIKSRDYNLYCSLIEMGDELSVSTKYDEAFEKYQAAKEIEYRVLKKPNLVLDSIKNLTGLNSINAQLKSAYFLIWANELKLADTAYLYCISLQKKYNLNNDVNCKTLLDSFKKKIELKSCQNIQDEIDQLNSKSNNFISIRDFEKAQLLIDEAKILINKNSNCNLSADKTEKILQFIKPITDYTQIKTKAKEAFEKSDFSLCTQLYYTADKLYKTSKLDTVGIPNSDFISYLNYQSNEQAMLSAVNFFITNYDFDYCLASLKLLKNKGYDAFKLKEIQINLAEKQAKIDKTHHADFNANVNILKYTADDKWFRVFNSTYKKTK
ncbi:MAG: hypothetical protein ACOYO1_06330 [Bacteroidales bacterium]